MVSYKNNVVNSIKIYIFKATAFLFIRVRFGFAFKENKYRTVQQVIKTLPEVKTLREDRIHLHPSNSIKDNCTLTTLH